ncbi:MAG TPA: hypothetical protein VJ550_04600 [Geomonas sp.]|nr:hypothetical protein [Geomonas sp.]
MTVIIDGSEFVSTDEVAAQLGTTELKVLMLLRQKALCGEQIDGSWFVTAASLACYDADAAVPAIPSCRSICTSSGCGCR